jgi:hypothetical protein
MYKVYQRLRESPLPDYIDKDTINKSKSINNPIKEFLRMADKLSFNTKTKNIIKKITKDSSRLILGEGSGRTAFITNNKTAIKVAIDNNGLEQNELEITALINAPLEIKKILPKLVDYDKDSYFTNRKKNLKRYG